MPECRAHHVLDASSFAVRKLHLDPLLLRARFFLTDAGNLAAHRTWFPWGYSTDTRALATLWTRLFRFRLDRLAVPRRIAEVLMGFHEIINREVILALVKPRAASDDLFEFNHRVNRSH